MSPAEPGDDGEARRDAVIGVDLGGTKCHALLADAGGAILHEDYRRSDGPLGPTDVLLGALAALRRAAAIDGWRVTGVAIGIPGVLDQASGRVRGGFNLGWDGFELRTCLDAALPMPYVVENDVNLAALGEARVGMGRGVRSFAMVSVGTGLGGAVVVDGSLLRGAHGAAGEFGLLLAGRRQLRRATPMAMEALVGGRSIAARARRLASRSPGATSLPADTQDAAGVFAAARRGDRVAGQVVDEMLDHLAMAIVDIAAVLDPELVVLDGSIGRSLVPHLQRLTGLVAPALLHPPEIVVSTLAPSAALAGAVSEAQRLADGADQASMSRTSTKR